MIGDLYLKRPDVIGFSCYIWNFHFIQELLWELAKVLPGTDIWLGGPEVSFEAEKLLREFPELKGIMVGEGEETFKELLSFYVEREERKESEDGSVLEVEGLSRLKEIPGLVLQGGATAARELTDMDKLPFLYLSGDTFSADGLADFENRIIYYETSRGCPFRCGYCLSSIFSGSKSSSG